MDSGAGDAGVSSQAGGLGQQGLRAKEGDLEFGRARGWVSTAGGAEELLGKALDGANLLRGRAGAVLGKGERRDPAICLRPVIINDPQPWTRR